MMMIPAGYMAKTIAPRPAWLKAPGVERILSVSGCMSAPFADYVRCPTYNAYGLFDSLRRIGEAAAELGVGLRGAAAFYYEAYQSEFDEHEARWRAVRLPAGLSTHVEGPQAACLRGYDVVTYSQGGMPECSPLSCNGLASEISVNSDCLLPSVEIAVVLLEDGRFARSEPGPFRIFSVYSLDHPSGEWDR